MATVTTVVLKPQTLENLLIFISKQPNFPTIYANTVLRLKRSIKIPDFPANCCETSIIIHKENFLKNIFTKKKVVLVLLVSAFVLLTGKTFEELVKFLFIIVFLING